MLWGSLYSPDAIDLDMLRGVPLPPPRSGSSRVASWGCFVLEPLEKGNPIGFRISGTSRVQLSSVQYQLLRWLPPPFWRRLLRTEANELPMRIREALHSGRADECISGSPRAKFYQD